MSDMTCRVGQKLISGGPFKSEVHPFCIDATEVTQEAFMGGEQQSWYELVQKRCDGTTGVEVAKTSAELRSSSWNQVDNKKVCGVDIHIQIPTIPSDRPIIEGKFLGPKKPMIYVNWNEALEYCQSRGGNLPTGAQWEKAAEGPRGKKYATKSGELKKEEAKFWNDDSAKGPVNVASYPPNDYEIRDMTGNVAEWTLDECSFGTRCVRGGSWGYNDNEGMRADNFKMWGNSTSFRSDGVGFRCVYPPQIQNAKK